MRLTIDDILNAHGLLSGPSPNFGNGSDGAFNPQAGSPPVTVTVTLNSDGKVYYQSGTGSPLAGPSTAGSIPVQLTVTGTTANGAANSPQTAIESTSGFTGGATSTSGAQAGIKMTVSQSITVSGAGIYQGMALTNPMVTIFDSTGAVIAQASVSGTTVANSWVTVTFGSPITLQAGTTYLICVYTSGSGPDWWTTFPASPQTISATLAYNATTTLSSTLDGAPVVKQFTSVNIPAYTTVTVSNRCKGLIMLVNGDVTINGTISMDGMGALLDPTSQSGYVVAEKVFQLYYPLGNNQFITIGPGGAGGAGGSCGTSGNYVQPPQGGNPTGGTWWGGGRGGGGAGGTGPNSSSPGGRGGDASYATSGSGGAAVSTTSVAAGNAGSNGAGGSGGAYAASSAYTVTSGAGGAANGAGGGGGGGGGYASATGSATAGSASSGGAGGLILIIARGNITINSGATLTAQGSAGGNGGRAYTIGASYYASGGGGGGGAGGGIVALLYRGTLTNSGTINVSGGAGGAGGIGTDNGNAQTGCYGVNGNNGCAGTVQTYKLP